MKKDYFKLIRIIEYIACILLLLLGFNKIEEGLIFTGLFRYVYPFVYLVVVTGLLLTLAIIMCLVLQYFTPYFLLHLATASSANALNPSICSGETVK